jgi:hypothetical protein
MSSSLGTLVIALLAAFWTGTSAVFAGMKLLIERRDAIELGRIGSVDLSPASRRRILLQEWVPIRGALGFVSAMLSVVILSLPALAQPSNRTLDVISMVAATVPLLGAAYFLLVGVIEYVQLRRGLPPSDGSATTTTPT